MRILKHTGLVQAPREQIFALLEDARQADRLTPPFLDIEVERSPWMPKVGDRTRLSIRHRGTGVALETELVEYRRGFFLLERQVDGPFVSFEHAVNLDDARDDTEAAAAGGATSVTEVLAYQLPFRWLGALFDRVSLRRDLDTLLRTRITRLRELLQAD